MPSFCPGIPVKTWDSFPYTASSWQLMPESNPSNSTRIFGAIVSNCNPRSRSPDSIRTCRSKRGISLCKKSANPSLATDRPPLRSPSYATGRLSNSSKCSPANRQRPWDPSNSSLPSGPGGAETNSKCKIPPSSNSTFNRVPSTALETSKCFFRPKKILG